MNKKEEGNNIVFDRDLSKPETKLKKMKQKKKGDKPWESKVNTVAKEVANSQINNNNNNNNNTKGNIEKPPAKRENKEEGNKVIPQTKSGGDGKTIDKMNNAPEQMNGYNSLVKNSSSWMNSKVNKPTDEEANINNKKGKYDEQGGIKQENMTDDKPSGYGYGSKANACDNNAVSYGDKMEKNKIDDDNADEADYDENEDYSPLHNNVQCTRNKPQKYENNEPSGYTAKNELNNYNQVHEKQGKTKQKENRSEGQNPQLNEVNKDLRNLNDSYLIEINFLKKELKGRDEKIRVWIEQYNHQKKNWEMLSREVDKKMEEINIYQWQRGQKGQKDQKGQKSQKGQKNQNGDVDDEDVVGDGNEKKTKSKEKELANALALIDILSKDNARLKGWLDTYGEYKKKLELQDWSKAKHDENLKLKHELDWLKRDACDHNHCIKKITDLQNWVSTHKNDVKRYKNENMELKAKIEFLLKNHAITSHEALDGCQISHHIKTKTIDFNWNDRNVSKKSLKLSNDFFRNNSNNHSNRMKNNIALTQDSSDNTRRKTLLKVTSSEHKSVSAIRNEGKFTALFSEEERKKICDLFNDSAKYESFIKKVIVLENYKVSAEAKHNYDIKVSLEKIDDWTEQIEYLNWKNKENESRLKIFQNQVNEFKSGKRSYQKKLNDLEGNSEKYKMKWKEKEQEIKLLTHKVQEMQGALNQCENEKDEEEEEGSASEWGDN